MLAEMRKQSRFSFDCAKNTKKVVLFIWQKFLYLRPNILLSTVNHSDTAPKTEGKSKPKSYL